MGKAGTAQDMGKWIVKKIFGKTDDVAVVKKQNWLDDFYRHNPPNLLDDISVTQKIKPQRADKVTMGKKIADRAKNLTVLGALKGTTIASIFVVGGFMIWKSTSLIGVLSEAAEETINNFYGINCEEGDTECQNKGAKNMLLTGLLVTAGVGGLIVLSLKKDSQEPVENDSQESVDAS
jgi:CDP-diglyceride synthetase